MTRLWLILVLVTWPMFVSAKAPVLTGAFIQGGLVHGTARPGTAIEFQGRKVRVDKDGRFIIRVVTGQESINVILPVSTVTRVMRKARHLI